MTNLYQKTINLFLKSVSELLFKMTIHQIQEDKNDCIHPEKENKLNVNLNAHNNTS